MLEHTGNDWFVLLCAVLTQGVCAGGLGDYQAQWGRTSVIQEGLVFWIAGDQSKGQRAGEEGQTAGKPA